MVTIRDLKSLSALEDSGWTGGGEIKQKTKWNKDLETCHLGHELADCFSCSPLHHLPWLTACWGEALKKKTPQLRVNVDYLYASEFVFLYDYLPIKAAYFLIYFYLKVLIECMFALNFMKFSCLHSVMFKFLYTSFEYWLSIFLEL